MKPSSWIRQARTKLGRLGRALQSPGNRGGDARGDVNVPTTEGHPTYAGDSTSVGPQWQDTRV